MADFQKFVDAGITTFDTGPEECGYGPSERIIGEYLKQAGDKAKDVQVYTKARPHRPSVKGEPLARQTASKTDGTDSLLAYTPCTLLQLLGLRHRRSQRSISLAVPGLTRVVCLCPA